MGVFTFKKFAVCDEMATMKVGTDAVLLGAWAATENSKRILDIGTGSGVIALMMAQRSHPDTTIDAVELLKEDSQQASLNILNSPWPERITVINTPIQDFFPQRLYDLIVCNPPFFVRSLPSPKENRTRARHQDTLPFEALIASAVRLLYPEGKLCLILPVAESQLFVTAAATNNLFLQYMTRFFTRPGKLQERSLMQFGFMAEPSREDSLFLYDQNGDRTMEYQQLTREFYLER